MIQTETPEVEYNGRKFLFQTPLGIYLDGRITGRIHDSIIPKYCEVDAERLVELDKEAIKTVKDDAIRQLNEIAQQDTERVKQSLKNTIDLTTRLLEN